MQDSAHILQQQVQEAFANKQALSIRGGNSKHFYGHPVAGEAIKTTAHTGIIEYEPGELILRARAGTSLAIIDEALQEHNQILASEPPRFSEHATLGGMIAAGLSGPGRAFRTSIQDSVLGATVLNGKGEILSFGGKVMKNVAGYDVSRLMTGTLGCLSILLDITLKVVPASAAERSIVFLIEKNKSVEFINDLRKQGLPVTATCQLSGKLIVRFSAGSREIADIEKILNKHYSFIAWNDFDDDNFWIDIREHKAAFFLDDKPLWRLSVPADADIEPLLNEPENLLTEWGGYLHWLKSDQESEKIFSYMEKINGNATLFRSSRHTGGHIFQPLAPALAQWHKGLKESFDPAGILNPGKMYQEL